MNPAKYVTHQDRNKDQFLPGLFYYGKIDLLTRKYSSCNIMLQGGFNMAEENNLGRKIRALREERGLSQLKVVERLEDYGIKMSRETLSKIENNSRSISAVELKALSRVLNVDMNDFFEEEEAEDMVAFFRRRNFSRKSLEEIAKLQEMVKVFIKHEKLYKEG